MSKSLIAGGRAGRVTVCAIAAVVLATLAGCGAEVAGGAATVGALQAEQIRQAQQQKARVLEQMKQAQEAEARRVAGAASAAD